MQKLQPSDIQDMLGRAAKVFTQSKDQEVMDRLVASTTASEHSQWDLKLIAAMLAKAGAHSESQSVIDDIGPVWEQADANCRVAKALFEIDDKDRAFAMLKSSAEKCHHVQTEGGDQDKQCAAAVLADVAELFAQHEKFDDAQAAAESIDHPIRRERALERVRELRGDEPEAEEAEIEHSN